MSDNAQAHSTVRWIMDNANMGFFIVTATHKQQREIADKYACARTAEYDYSKHSGGYSFYALENRADANPKADVLFVLNMQIALQDDENIAALNTSRDVLAEKQKIWIFFMTKDTEYRLSLHALDFYAYVRIKVHFAAEEETAPTGTEILDFHNRHNVEMIHEMLEQYKPLEEQLMALPTDVFNNFAEDYKNRLLSAAVTLSNIAELYENCADYNRALELYSKALQIRENVLAIDDADIAVTCHNIGYIHDAMGEYDTAIKWHEKALIIKKGHIEINHQSVAITYNSMGAAYYSKNDFTKALEMYENALDIYENQLEAEHIGIAFVCDGIANVYRKQGKYGEALNLFNKALAVCEKKLGNEHPETASTYNNIASVYYALGEHHKALELHYKALRIREKALGTQHPHTANSYNNIGYSYFRQGDYVKGMDLFKKAYRIFFSTLGDAHPRTILSKSNMEDNYKALNLPQPFDAWFAENFVP
ncbi:MAG: tetratricopeptide repeat protein [Defluviitaleaceae bacterium]|nr:tetratricopeptide repeat protein [Defluviitaleaceae bacterium]